jgi:hypothetical protein
LKTLFSLIYPTKSTNSKLIKTRGAMKIDRKRSQQRASAVEHSKLKQRVSILISACFCCSLAIRWSWMNTRCLEEVEVFRNWKFGFFVVNSEILGIENFRDFGSKKFAKTKISDVKNFSFLQFTIQNLCL